MVPYQKNGMDPRSRYTTGNVTVKLTVRFMMSANQQQQKHA